MDKPFDYELFRQKVIEGCRLSEQVIDNIILWRVNPEIIQQPVEQERDRWL